MELEGIDHVALSVRNLEAAVKWYIEVLGFEPKFPGQWSGVPTFLGKGTTALAIFPARHEKSTAPGHGPRLLHLAFRADRKGFVAAQKELKDRGIEFTFEDHEISHSIYFVDPDGHKLEITCYDLSSARITRLRCERPGVVDRPSPLGRRSLGGGGEGDAKNVAAKPPKFVLATRPEVTFHRRCAQERPLASL